MPADMLADMPSADIQRCFARSQRVYEADVAGCRAGQSPGAREPDPCGRILGLIHHRCVRLLEVMLVLTAPHTDNPMHHTGCCSGSVESYLIFPKCAFYISGKPGVLQPAVELSLR